MVPKRGREAPWAHRAEAASGAVRGRRRRSRLSPVPDRAAGDLDDAGPLVDEGDPQRIRSEREGCRRAGLAHGDGLEGPGPARIGGVPDFGRDAIARVLESINPRYRRAIELRFLEEQPREACATALGVTLGTFDVVLLRALRAFRAQWSAAIGEGM